MADGEELILTIADLKRAGSVKLPKVVRDYFNEGAMEMLTLRENEAAYNRFKIRTRILTDVSTVDTSTELLGRTLPLPFGWSPAAMHCLAHPDGERATVRAAKARGIAMGLSTYSTVSLEDVAAERGDDSSGTGMPLGFQLSVVKDRQTTLDWIRRAEAAGYQALFITVDAPVLGQRLNEVRNHLTLPAHLSLPNLDASANRTHHYAGRDPSNSWASVLPWVKANTKLQIWLKGILTPEDVLLAIRYQVDGVIVSNHGGRQLDGAPATIEALPACAEAAKGRIKIAVDGGIRRGSDIFKALALGADFVFTGRVPLWGLAYDGEAGVALAIRILEEELRTTMALAGCATIKDISRAHLGVIGPSGYLCRL